MICTPCLKAADGTWPARSVCSVCKSPRAVYNSGKPVGEQSVVVHKNGWERCPGSTEPPVIRTGHDECKGCTCQHRPKGAWRGKRT